MKLQIDDKVKSISSSTNTLGKMFEGLIGSIYRISESSAIINVKVLKEDNPNHLYFKNFGLTMVILGFTKNNLIPYITDLEKGLVDLDNAIIEYEERR